MRAPSWLRFLMGCLLLAGCDPERRESGTDAAAPPWLLDTDPVLTIGVAEGEEPYELAGAHSSLRLPDGRIVIANSGAGRLQVYDSTGRFLVSIGRPGEGPGEFTGSLQMIALSGGEIGVFDQSAQRLSVFDTAGALLRDTRPLTDRGGDFPLWIWLYRTAWVSGPGDTLGREGIRRALETLPPPPPGAWRFVQVATDDRIWFQERTPGAVSPQPWAILSPAGAPLGRITLPEDSEVHQIGPDYVLLRQWGENDVERIRLFRFRAGGSDGRRMSGRPGTADPVRATATEQVRTAMAGAMRNLVAAQEMFYMDSAAYARSAGSLNWEGPPGTTLHLLAADKRGWVGVLVHQSQPVLCGMAVGGSTPPGWSEGSPTCSR